MRNRFFHMALLLVLALSIGMLTGCKDDNGDGDKGSPTGPSGNSEISGWPDDLPAFNYGELYQSLVDENTGEFQSAIYMNISNPENVFNQYKSALENNGWAFEVDGSNETTWVVVYEKDDGDRAVHVGVAKDGSMATIMYVDLRD